MKALKKIGKITLWFLSILVGFLLIVLIWFRSVSPGITQPITQANGEIVENSIAEIIRPEINGIEQFLIIRGNNLNNPVLLMLHGGPGSPQAHLNLLHNKELEKHYIVVNWDQRGAGATYNDKTPEETMTIDQFIEDTYEVTEYLKKQFKKEKIFLLGHSWGSYLGMRTIYKYPDSYIAYIGIGQVSDQRKSEDLSYAYVYNKAKELNNTEAINDLEAIGAPINGNYKNPAHDIQLQRKWVTEFGGAAYGKTYKNFVDIMIKPLLKFEAYKMADKINYIKGIPFTQQLLWPQMMNQQLVDVVKKVDVPVYIFHGIHDYQTVYSEANAYIDSLIAPKKEFYSFKNSSHLLPYNLEIGKFHGLMIDIAQKCK